MAMRFVSYLDTGAESFASNPLGTVIACCLEELTAL
jgi:hypothetical protein